MADVAWPSHSQYSSGWAYDPSRNLCNRFTSRNVYWFFHVRRRALISPSSDKPRYGKYRGFFCLQYTQIHEVTPVSTV